MGSWFELKDVIRSKKSPTGFVVIRTFNTRDGFKTTVHASNKEGETPDIRKDIESEDDILSILLINDSSSYFDAEEASEGHNKTIKRWGNKV
jgi:hypothetical protein